MSSCGTFWTGCGYEWLASHIGTNATALIVVILVGLYVFDQLTRSRVANKAGILDTEAEAHRINIQADLTTDT